MRVIDKKGSRQRPGDASTVDEPGDGDRKFLEQDREESAAHAAAERNQQRHPLRRLLHEIGGDLETHREPQRRDEEPEKFPAKEQNRYADDDADNRDGKVHDPRSICWSWWGRGSGLKDCSINAG